MLWRQVYVYDFYTDKISIIKDIGLSYVRILMQL